MVFWLDTGCKTTPHLQSINPLYFGILHPSLYKLYYAIKTKLQPVTRMHVHIEVSQSRDILTSRVFVTPCWRSSQSLPAMLSHRAAIVKVFI